MARFQPPRHARYAERDSPQLRRGVVRRADGSDAAACEVLKGFGGAGVLELVENDAAGTYRAVYTVRYPTDTYVLHVFQKKSKRGRETPQADVELIKERIKRAREINAIRMKEGQT